MKIDVVYVFCCKKDFYLTRVCIASIRYWNKAIPISLIKDNSHGFFDTSEMEKSFHLDIAPILLNNLGFYSKLYPFFNGNGERAILMDSDIVWVGNLIQHLEKFDEDLVIQGYSPDRVQQEMEKWFFNLANLQSYYPDYSYPGYLFNCGQMILNTTKFGPQDFSNCIEWKENMRPYKENVFIGEDQGILNYVVAAKKKKGEISIRLHNFFLWGWDPLARQIKAKDVNDFKGLPVMIHWYGSKNGLLSFLPNSELLKFYEKYYYQFLKLGNIKMIWSRLKRTILHLDAFAYEILKKIYYISKSSKGI